jgi:hypothetical protein
MKKKSKFSLVAVSLGAVSIIGACLYFILRKKDKSSDDTTKSDSTSNSISKKLWSFKDNYFTGSFTDVGHLGFVGDTKPPFSVGDIIYVTQADGAKYPQYNGMTKIDSINKVNEGWVVDTTKSRRGNTPVNGGIITNYKEL